MRRKDDCTEFLQPQPLSVTKMIQEVNLMKSKQQGVALIMVLVFLLLMTLISATAMQQNSLQFLMIGNTQEQSKSFSTAENILKLIENTISQQRWSTARNLNPLNPATIVECRETAAGSGFYGLVAPGTVINLGIPGVTAVVQGWWCQNNPDMALADIDQDGDGVVDIDFGRPVSCAVAGACPAIPTIGYAPFPNLAPAVGFEMGCGTELYTINVTFEPQNGDAGRIVESKFGVQCLEVGI